jgi:2-keto-4-pentenoate hydratase
MLIDINAAVERLLRGRLGPEVGDPLTGESADLSLDDAYAIQRRLEDTLVARGHRVIGWKVGLTSPPLQESYGVGEPVLGFLLDSGIFGSGDAVPHARFAGLAVEAEVALLLRADLAGPGVSAARALLAVEGAMPALELVDFRHRGTPRGADLIADGVYASAVVLGRPLTPLGGLDLALEGVVYEHNGRIVGTHTCAEVLGDPLNSLAWLANALGRMGRTLRAGDVVLTGSISKIVRAQRGDAMRASFTRLGAVSCRFA